MAKKKAAGGKKKKKGADDKKGKAKKAGASEGSALESAGPTELEVSLRMELDALERELERAKVEAEEARKNNQWLQEELARSEEEMREYEEYMGKKTQREHSRMQGLTDATQREIEAMEAEKQRRRIDYEDVRKALNQQILEKEGQLHRVNTEIDDLAQFQQKRTEQNALIQQLQTEIKTLEAAHSESEFCAVL